MTKRLNKEFELVSKKYDIEICNENLFHWHAALLGPDKSPYFGGTFLLEIKFPNDYPFTHPTIKFLTKIFHPNVDPKGNVCIAILNEDNWTPAFSLDQILLKISNLLAIPNTDDPLQPDIAKMYESDRENFLKIASEWTTKYAC
jgi:ubiquitin-conjugating enzyme E2 D